MDWWNKSGQQIVGDLMYLLGQFLYFVNEFYTKVIDPIIKLFVEVLKPSIGTVMAYITGLIRKKLDDIANKWNTFKGILQGIIEYIKGIFTGDWSRAWEGVKTVFNSIVESIKTSFKNSINFIVDIMNGFIKGVNKVKVPDWVPGVGGRSVNIPLIPRLAKGGIVDKATLAMIGEGKSAEAVIPLDRTLTKYMAEAMKQAGSKQPLVVNFYPQQMTETELEKAFNYLNKRFGMAY